MTPRGTSFPLGIFTTQKKLRYKSTLGRVKPRPGNHEERRLVEERQEKEKRKSKRVKTDGQRREEKESV
jgi:hypothetical protein